MRLQKYLAHCGAASRRACEAYIAQGRVTVNGRVVATQGTQVMPGDVVCLDGREMRPEARKAYILYHKPIGEVCTASDPQGRPTVLDRFRDFPQRLYPVGRLDFDSEGLLLLTNDGDLCHRLISPKHKVEKVYYFKCQSPLSDPDRERLEGGVVLDGRLTLPAKLKLYEDRMSGELTLTEGKFHQVKRMLEAVGNKVTYLERIEFASITLDQTLARGEWRYLTADEESVLRRAAELE